MRSRAALADPPATHLERPEALVQLDPAVAALEPLGRPAAKPPPSRLGAAAAAVPSIGLAAMAASLQRRRRKPCRSQALGRCGLAARHCSSEDGGEELATEQGWAAPSVFAEGAPGDGRVALGAVEHVEDGRVWLHAQVQDDAGWRPVLLRQTASDAWEGGGVRLRLPLDAIAAASWPGRPSSDMRGKAPAWPSGVAAALEGWPLKGPGTVVMDPQLFMQRGVALANRPGAGPVLFPAGAHRLRLPTTALLPQAEEFISGRPLREVLGSEASDDFGQLLQRLPESIARGHFDLARAAGSAPGQRPGNHDVFEVVLHEQPLGLSCESKAWASGAVVRRVVAGSEAERAGCREGDVVWEVGEEIVSGMLLDDVDRLLRAPPVRLLLSRPQLSDCVYLRETPAVDEALSAFAGSGASAEALVPEMLSRMPSRDVFFSERTPMLFVGDGGTASHVHVDKKPLIQFCHVLHGTKLFGVAPLAMGHPPGSAAPWEASPQGREAGPSGGATTHEVSLPVDAALPELAAAWLERPEVSVAAAEPGDLLLFQGRVPHFGANALGGLCVALFHGAQPVADMARGVFGAAYQALGMKLMQG